MLTPFQSLNKRLIDLTLAIIGISLTWWLILIAWIVASLDTRANGMFAQKRVGKDGKLFYVLKIRTMRPKPADSLSEVEWSTVTTANDGRITPLGRLWRKLKIDELPQLINVLLGQMSFVGPRPDVPGFADCLQGDDRAILSLRPGITGPATLKYRNEEEILAGVEDPAAFNREVIFPDKVRLNKEYLDNWSISNDLYYIAQTVLLIFANSKHNAVPTAKTETK